MESCTQAHGPRRPAGLSPHRREFWKAWIAAILWLIVIAIESTALLSSHNTSRILYPVLHYLFGVDPVRFETWHFYIRKSGHVVGYGILSVLAFRAWRETFPAPGNRVVDRALGQHRGVDDGVRCQPG